MSTNPSRVAVTLGGQRVELVGAAAADFATEFQLRESHAHPATKRAFDALHDLLGSSELSTAQKRHVDAAISELRKVR